jgi:hypothetical protein
VKGASSRHASHNNQVNHFCRAWHQTILEEEAMHEKTDKHKSHDPVKHDLENTSMSRPDWALDHHSPRTSNETVTRVIPQSFLDAILDVIAQSIEQVLGDVMARCVAEGIEQKIRPLTQEIALLRIAIEHEWECSTRRQRENTQ